MDENTNSDEKPQEAPGGSETRDVRFLDLFDPRQPRSDQELVEDRLAICLLCPHLNKKYIKCNKCGCFMKLKTTLRSAHCPIGKW